MKEERADFIAVLRKNERFVEYFKMKEVSL
jgi:hypothetical protein